MTPPSHDPHDYHRAASRSETFARLRASIMPEFVYRSKQELDPVIPLPRWTSWAFVAWTVGTAMLYTADPGSLVGMRGPGPIASSDSALRILRWQAILPMKTLSRRSSTSIG